ncbi:MAG: hypothetical protein ABI559_13555 [Chloroflexota bacterium]
MNDNKKLAGWVAILGICAVTASVMFGARQIGLAKTPSAASQEEDSGGTAADAIDPNAAGPASGTVDVKLSEWAITTSVPSAPAGAITFNIENTGPSSKHEFIVLKTDIAPASLPTLNDGSLDESGDGITSPGEGGILAVGQKQTVTLPMTEGKYVFVDNIVEDGTVHWQKKAYATFTVGPVDTGSGASAATGDTKITSLTSPVSTGQNATVAVKTSPGASCSIVYTHPSGKTSTATGLDPKTAGADGTVSWTWLIATTTKPLGNGKVLVTCGGKSAQSTIVIK